MFNIEGSELIFLLLIALVVLGPEKLPGAVRKFGKAYGEFKKVANGFQTEFKQVLDEPLRELQGTADALRQAARFDTADSSLTTRQPTTDSPSGPVVSSVANPAAERSEELDFGAVSPPPANDGRNPQPGAGR